MGMSLGAYHAANTLFRYPHLIKRCYGLSGVYDLRRFMDGMYDDNFYFHNPVDYVANLSDEWILDQLRSCEIRLVDGSGPWEESGSLVRVLGNPIVERESGTISTTGVRAAATTGPYWREMMREYLSGGDGVTSPGRHANFSSRY